MSMIHFYENHVKNKKKAPNGKKQQKKTHYVEKSLLH